MGLDPTGVSAGGQVDSGTRAQRFSHLQRDARADLLFFIDDRLRPGEGQLPTVDVIPGSGDDRRLG